MKTSLYILLALAMTASIGAVHGAGSFRLGTCVFNQNAINQGTCLPVTTNMAVSGGNHWNNNGPACGKIHVAMQWLDCDLSGDYAPE